MLRNIIIGFMTLATVALTAGGQSDRPILGKASGASVSRQLMLKYRLRKIADGTLTASLDHNRQEWRRLSADQRDRYRRDALAFLGKSDDEQRKLLAQYEKLARLSARKRRAYQHRAKWLKVVVASFSPAELKALRDLPPRRRARRLLERRDELVRYGKLILEPEKTPAATAPATRASSKSLGEE